MCSFETVTFFHVNQFMSRLKVKRAQIFIKRYCRLRIYQKHSKYWRVLKLVLAKFVFKNVEEKYWSIFLFQIKHFIINLL